LVVRSGISTFAFSRTATALFYSLGFETSTFVILGFLTSLDEELAVVLFSLDTFTGLTSLIAWVALSFAGLVIRF
jgi:hypothetical protein